MGTENYKITSWVVVRNHNAIRNGSVFFVLEEVDELSFVKGFYRHLKCDYPKFFKMDNLCKLAFVAAELLLKDHKPKGKPEEVALVFSNAGASLDTDKTYFSSVEDKSNYFPSPAVFVYTLPNIMMGEICIRHRFLGENAFFISEKFDGALLADYSESILSSGKATSVIAGWVEINDKEWEAVLFLIEPKENTNQRLSQATLERIYNLSRR